MTRAMDIDPETAASLGFAKVKYLAIERERRWLASLVGVHIRKLRHRLRSTIPGVKLHVDELQGAHAGLFLAEAEFESADARAAFREPPFVVVREVTTDLRYTGGMLVRDGVPR